MFNKLRSLLRVTAVKLSLAYTIAFGILAVIVVIYMTGGAVDFLKQQVITAVNEEVTSLEKIHEETGLNGLVQAMELRASAPGANLYVIADPSGRIIAGNILDIEKQVLETEGWTKHTFEYEGFQDVNYTQRAMARVFKLSNGMRILVGQDIGEPERFKKVVSRALWFAMGTMLAASFLIWIFVGRTALKRIDMVSNSTKRIMAGDRSERLPVTDSNDEFDRLSINMNEMLDRIGLLDKGLQQVSDSIAHDLKTPLTRLRNKVDSALSSDPDLPTSKHALEEVITDSDQLIKTFNALLMISRVESGSQVAEMSSTNMSDIMADACELYEPVAEEEGFEITHKLEAGLNVDGSRELLSQAVTNLLDNAMKYGKPNTPSMSEAKSKKGKSAITPTIHMSLKKQGDKIIASICDNGLGIPADKRDEVKIRFARLDESRSKPGTGLGLSLVEAVAKLHGGALELDDANPGLVVRLVLPTSKT